MFFIILVWFYTVLAKQPYLPGLELSSKHAKVVYEPGLGNISKGYCEVCFQL